MRTVTGMFGLGDNIYQRAVVREMGPINLVTTWPQLYADLPNVRCLPAKTSLRTQARNVEEYAWGGRRPPTKQGERLTYVFKPASMLQSLLESVHLGHLDKVTFDLPTYASNCYVPLRPYVVVRPATVRKEWPASGRNPAEGYIARAAQRALDDGLGVVSVADLKDGEEWPVDELPPATIRYHHGELKVTDLMALVQHSAGVIGGVGWLLPAALAYRVPMLLLYGGWGAYNCPEKILDPRIDSSRVVQAMPERFCRCTQFNDHTCDKYIPNLERHINDFLRQIHQSSAGLAA